ncbi:MAG: DUF1905 domain-containing protein [Flavisolibacter sp.]|nr:DUF1905 domain-containing protein [Flavisolibacter sp.]MBD0287626.1 DUF1905 domain-containing protein [Flavisolibacter sp.]MBD0351278.1 DUF1905 domain-containing protein [Flavisolibacter sp.]MBD0366812.1 DUF1905 domain-containing protein [Flavisolibacter sp.]MBD0375349.1 DUF1905 domain-containing protein [Flavisolibacter sp.]
MIHYSTIIKKFGQQGEKTGWTYIEVPAVLAQQLKPGNKKSFRVKGNLDAYTISGVALMPMGTGDFIMPVNAPMRKGIRKGVGAELSVQLEIDENEIKPPAELIECLEDEPEALHHFRSLAKSHQLYFTRWIQSAKTEVTKTKRIALSVSALAKKQGFGEMLRDMKKDKLNGVEE